MDILDDMGVSKLSAKVFFFFFFSQTSCVNAVEILGLDVFA